MARPCRYTTPTWKRTPRQSVRGSEVWMQPSIDRPHWNEALDALQEDVDFCEDGETTIARDGAIAIPGVFNITDDGQEATVEENEVPQILLQARPAFRHSGYGAVREELNAAQKARGFCGPRRGAGGREQGPRMKRSSIQQLKPRTRCARCRKLGHWARECPEGNRGQRNDERYDRRGGRPEDDSKGFIAAAGHGTETVLSWGFLDVRRSRPWRGPVGYWRSKGTRRGTPTERVVQVACGMRSTGRMEPGATRIRKRYRRRDEAIRSCICASRISRVQRCHPLHCCGARCSTTTARIWMTTARKVIFRQCGGESVLIARIEKWAHGRPFVPTNMISMVGSFQKLRNCVRPIIKESSRCTNDKTPAGDNDVASTRSRKTTAKNSIGRRRNCNISSDKPSHVIVSVQEW